MRANYCVMHTVAYDYMECRTSFEPEKYMEASELTQFWSVSKLLSNFK